jgi:hypothetical protein
MVTQEQLHSCNNALPWRWQRYQPKHFGENIVSKIHHNFLKFIWYLLLYFWNSLDFSLSVNTISVAIIRCIYNETSKVTLCSVRVPIVAMQHVLIISSQYLYFPFVYSTFKRHIFCAAYFVFCRSSDFYIIFPHYLIQPGIESRWGEIFRTCPHRPWGPPSLLYNGYRVFPGGIKRPGRDADPL